MIYQPSNACYTIVKKWEGLRLKAYKDSKGVWTIGYGTTDTAVAFEGNTITKKVAEEYLTRDVLDAFDTINKLVKAPLSQPQADALGCLIYNIGESQFSRSTLLKKLNTKDYLGAWAEFPKWRKAGGKVVAGLVSRRQDEAALFLSGTKVAKEAKDALGDESNPRSTESNLVPTSPSDPAQSIGRGGAAVSGAAIVAETAKQIEPLTPFSEYIGYAFVALTLITIGFTVWKVKKGD